VTSCYLFAECKEVRGKRCLLVRCCRPRWLCSSPLALSHCSSPLSDLFRSPRLLVSSPSFALLVSSPSFALLVSSLSFALLVASSPLSTCLLARSLELFARALSLLRLAFSPCCSCCSCLLVRSPHCITLSPRSISLLCISLSPLSSSALLVHFVYLPISRRPITSS
jgi:hypothetical protein